MRRPFHWKLLSLITRFFEMKVVLKITPERFVASGGKLDTDKRYVSKTHFGGYEWPGPATETLYQTSGGVGFKNRPLIGPYNSIWYDSGKFYLDI